VEFYDETVRCTSVVLLFTPDAGEVINAAAHGFVNYNEESGVPHLFTAFIGNICRGSFAYITAFLEVKINAPLLGCRRGPLRKVLYLLIGGEVFNKAVAFFTWVLRRELIQ